MDKPDRPTALTETLVAARNGDDSAVTRLSETLYGELRAIAANRLRREVPNHTLQATALVNEVYLRLVDQRRSDWRDRSHFLAIAAGLMRRILVDHARAKRAQKRGGGLGRVTLGEPAGSSNDVSMAGLVDLDDALNALARHDPRAAEIVQLRYFGGLSDVEVAEQVGISDRMVRKEWVWAREWLRRRLGQSDDRDR